VAGLRASDNGELRVTLHHQVFWFVGLADAPCWVLVPGAPGESPESPGNRVKRNCRYPTHAVATWSAPPARLLQPRPTFPCPSPAPQVHFQLVNTTSAVYTPLNLKGSRLCPSHDSPRPYSAA
jgi:hypothetical protein